MTTKTVRYDYAGDVWHFWTEGALLGDERPDDASRPWPDVAVSEELHGEDPWTFTWDTDLTSEEEEQWDRAVKKAERRSVPVDDDELEPYWDTMRSYFNASSPSDAATVQALKATIKVLREMMKE